MKLFFRFKTTSSMLLVLLVALPVCSQDKDDIVMKAMRDELARSTSQLHMDTLEKPYFISYRIDDLSGATVSASLGSVTQSNPVRARIIGVEVRVGDYAFDNSNYVSADSFGGMGMGGGVSQGPLDDDYQQIRRQLWLTTDAQYKHAAEEFSAKKAALANRKRTESVADFSKESPATLVAARKDAQADLAALEQLVRDASLPFKQMPDVVTSSVQIEFKNVYTRYVNSEGSVFTRSQPGLILHIDGETQSADGLPIHDSIQLFGRSIADLPSKTELVTKARELGQRLVKLRTASSAERYNGPVLFEDEAAAEVFAQAFAPGLVASRIPDSDDPRFEVFFKQMLSQMGLGSTLLDRIGGRVLPDSMDLVDDPRAQEYKGRKLAGSYDIDDDAIPTRQTKLVEKGTLKTLLASRVPVRTLTHSTGSRRSLGAVPSNLILTADKTSSSAELREELLRRVKQRGLDYGIIVRRTGGNAGSSVMRAAATMAQSPQSTPSNTLLEVYKVFPDRHEEPIKGAELSGMNAAAFRDIVAVGDKPVVFNQQVIPNINSIFTMGMAGGLDMPVASFVVPSLLFEEVSLTKAEGPFPAPPASKAPLAGN
jgi:predicted Zn-dependent protease